MTYPQLPKGWARTKAAEQFRRERIGLTLIRTRLAEPLMPGEDPEVKERVLLQMRRHARSHQAGMRQMLHALFD